MGTVRTTPAPPLIPKTRYLFFGGKGGVGKTTCATATAFTLLEHAKSGEKLLLFSTDPAHSLADSLGSAVGNQLRRVASHKGAVLDAWEMDAVEALNAFKAKHSTVLKTIANRGTLLDEADIDSLLNLSLPGMDEVMALFELSEFDRSNEYVRIIVDTAPSGHTTRLLQLPDVFTRWIKALDHMTKKHRFMVAHIARRGPAPLDEVDTFLDDLTDRVSRVRDVLYAADKSSFIMVTIPELMAVEETRRYVAEIKSQDIPLTDLVINKVEQTHRSCEYCKARTEAQRPYLKQLEEEFKHLRCHRIPLLPVEVRGSDALHTFGRLLWEKPATSRKELHTRDSKRSTHETAEIGDSNIDLLSSLRRIFIVGGKGGVGKTTTAASLSIALAETYPSDRFLVVSTDPAHSLSDSLSESIGSFKSAVGGLANLDGMEINAVETFERLKERYRRWIDDVFTALTGESAWRVEFDREAMQELIALAPPGMDEIAALSAISDFLADDAYTSIVLDTAPTGHLLRFLELPGVALEWVRTFIKLILKYRNVVTSDSVAEELVTLSRSIKRVIAALKDPRMAEMIAVAIPAQMSLSETEDLARCLGSMSIPIRRLLINNVIPTAAAEKCVFCRERRAQQLDYIEKFKQAFSSKASLLLAPQMTEEIRGPDKLREFWSNLGMTVQRLKTRGQVEA